MAWDAVPEPMVEYIDPGFLDRDRDRERENFSISCELGVRYQTLKAMLNREDLHLRMAVSICHILVVFLSYSVHIPVIYQS